MTTPPAATLADALLGPVLRADAARPLLTYYDDATGERVELSGTTLANWAAKTANLLREELGVAPGDRVAVLLPAHWQSVAVYLGVWWCGAVVDDDSPSVAFCTADRLTQVPDVPEVVVLSLDAFGRGVADLPLGVTDYASTVRVQGDAFAATRMDPSSPALAQRSIGQVLTAAQDSAARQGFTAQDRVLSQSDWATPAQLVDGLLAVLAAGASLVQVAHPDEDALTRRVSTERVTLVR